MKNLNLSLFIVLIIFVSSCGGVKFNRELSPSRITVKPRSQEEILNYLSEHHVSFEKEDVYGFKDVEEFSEYTKPGKVHLPEIYFFNRNGEMVENRFNKGECSNVINEIDSIKTMPFSKSDKLTDKIQFFSNVFSEKSAVKEPDYDYYVIIKWGMFVDSVSGINSQSFEWFQETQEQISNGKKIKCYLVNLDLRDTWDYSGWSDELKKAYGVTQ